MMVSWLFAIMVGWLFRYGSWGRTHCEYTEHLEISVAECNRTEDIVAVPTLHIRGANNKGGI